MLCLVVEKRKLRTLLLESLWINYDVDLFMLLNPAFKATFCSVFVLKWQISFIHVPLFKQCYPPINFTRNAAHHSEYAVDLKSSLARICGGSGQLAFDPINIKHLHTLTCYSYACLLWELKLSCHTSPRGWNRFFITSEEIYKVASLRQIYAKVFGSYTQTISTSPLKVDEDITPLLA